MRRTTKVARSGLLGQFQIDPHPSERLNRIEAVLFDIWVGGHLARRWYQRWGMAIQSPLVSTLFFVFGLPGLVLRQLPTITIALLVTWLVGASIPGILNLIALFTALMIVFNYESLRLAIRNFLFDVGDILSFGYLSKWTAYKFKLFRVQSGFSDHDKMKEFLFVKRVLTSGPNMEELDTFGDFAENNRNSGYKIDEAIKAYWAAGDEGKDRFWRDMCKPNNGDPQV